MWGPSWDRPAENVLKVVPMGSPEAVTPASPARVEPAAADAGAAGG